MFNRDKYFSDNDEISMGQQFDQEIRKNTKEYSVYNGDSSVKEYINNRIFLEIVKSTELKNTSVYRCQM